MNNLYLGVTPLLWKKQTHLLGGPMSCSWWRIPIQSGPLLETNCPHPYFPNPPHPHLPPLAPTILQRRHQQFRFLDLEQYVLYVLMWLNHWTFSGHCHFKAGIPDLLALINLSSSVIWLAYNTRMEARGDPTKSFENYWIFFCFVIN